MDAAQSIREMVSKVFDLRARNVADPPLGRAVNEVKLFQARRFEKTYGDILTSGPYQHATKFFLEELYGDKDYSHRDQQFSRIAGALQRLLPQQAVATALLLARLHLMTEELDQAMGLAWLDFENPGAAEKLDPRARALRISWVYVNAWRQVGQIENRRQQLKNVLAVGQDLNRLTQTPGLRLMLKLMRRPAEAAGLGDLQHFLESGFDTFAKLAERGGAVQGFLALIEQRESDMIQALFEVPSGEMAAQLTDET